ncbi:DUF2066 domain-containing protein [Halopseudomonas pachastrellae]|nr:DUF2066 domain-containing protein [Halopseudomonas pachastrellae]
MPLSRFFSVGFFSLCLPLAAHAAVLDSLYEVQLPPQADAEQSAQLSSALDVMLERLAGNSLDEEAPTLAKVLAEPSSVTRQISSLQDDGSMQVEFDPLLLRDALTQAQVPMLGRNRPGVLVWAVQRDELGEDFMAPGSEMGQALRTAARFRGVALMQPLLTCRIVPASVKRMCWTATLKPSRQPASATPARVFWRWMFTTIRVKTGCWNGPSGSTTARWRVKNAALIRRSWPTA